MIEQTNNAYQLQIKAQKAAEEAIVHLKSYISEQEILVLKEKIKFYLKKKFIYL